MRGISAEGRVSTKILQIDVLVQHADGRQTIEEVKDDLHVKGEDNIRKNLASNGIKDVKSIGYTYGSDATRKAKKKPPRGLARKIQSSKRDTYSMAEDSYGDESVPVLPSGARVTRKVTSSTAPAKSVWGKWGIKVNAYKDEALKKCKAVFNKRSLKELWNRLDYNGNKIVSLAEIDKMVVELSKTNKYGGFFKTLNHKPALMRAYKWTASTEGAGMEMSGYKRMSSNNFF